MVSVTLADFVVSVTEVAVMVTVLPAGTAEGAVYEAMYSGAFEASIEPNVPQAEEPHVAVKVAPALRGSLRTLYIRVTGSLIDSVFGASGTAVCKVSGEMLIEDGTMVKVSLLVCDGLPVAVAAMVTAWLMGTTEGAV
jgi:type IV secretory pathway protease TraF